MSALRLLSYLLIGLSLLTSYISINKSSTNETCLEIQKVVSYKGTINGIPKWLEISFINLNNVCENRRREGKISSYKLKDDKKVIEINKSILEEPFVLKNDSLRLLTYSSKQILEYGKDLIRGTIANSKTTQTYDLKLVTRNPEVADCFFITTKDTLGKNRFSGDTINVQLYKTLKIYRKNSLVQEIQNINEEAFSISKNNFNIHQIKLADYNNDNFLDIILTYAPDSRLYDNDDVIFLFDPKVNRFSNKKLYRLKNLSDAQFRKLYGPH